MARKPKKPDPDSLPTLNKQEIEALMADIVLHKGEHEPYLHPTNPRPNNKGLVIRLTLPQDITSEEASPSLERMRATLLYMAYDSLPKSLLKPKREPGAPRDRKQERLDANTYMPHAEFVAKPEEGILECHITNLAQASGVFSRIMQDAAIITGSDDAAKQAKLDSTRAGFERVKPLFYQEGHDIKAVLDR